MGNDADQAIPLRKINEGIDCLFQRVSVQRAKAFVYKHGIELHAAGGRLDLLGQAQCQRQRRFEGFAARERADAACACGKMVDDVDVQAALFLRPQANL